MNKDIVKQITGFLMATLLFFGTLNIKFEWFSADSINAFGVVLTASIPLVITLRTIYKNHFGFTKKAKLQKAFLEKENLK